MNEFAILGAIVLSATMMGLDAYLTIRALKRGFTEMNPIMRWIMNRFGVTGGLVLTKTVLISLAFVVSFFFDATAQVAILATPGIIHIPVVFLNWRRTR